MSDATALLLEHYRSAEAEHLFEGGRWYRESRREARRLSRQYGVTMSTAAGVIAALSPRVRWAVNLRTAETMLAGGDARGLGESLRKAQAVLEGSRPLDVLRGPKTRAFYRAIMGDESAVTVDVWMMRAVGRAETAPKSPADYCAIAETIAEAAAVVGETPATFQAIVWTTVRRRASRAPGITKRRTLIHAQRSNKRSRLSAETGGMSNGTDKHGPHAASR